MGDMPGPYLNEARLQKRERGGLVVHVCKGNKSGYERLQAL
jgi:hypothetical protein